MRKLVALAFLLALFSMTFAEIAFLENGERFDADSEARTDAASSEGG